MNKHPNFKENLAWFLVIVGILIISVSFTMTMLSKKLESKTEAAQQESSEFWVDEEQVNVINVLAAGALMPDASETEGSGIFSGLEKVIRNYDYAAASVHALVGTDLSAGCAGQLYDSGFNMSGLAYPGVFSHGREAVDQASAYWSDSKMWISGISTSTDAANQIRVSERNGVSAAILSYTDGLSDALPENETYLVSVYDAEKSPQQVMRAAELADVVIITIAWDQSSDETAVDEHQRQIAKTLADAGASVIIGCREHVLQPIEWIDDTLVFYSLGSLYSNEDEAENSIGALGAVTITETIRGSSRRIELTNPKVDPVITVKTQDGTHTQFLSDTTEEEVAGAADLYSSCVEILHRLDDSIRIGGLG